MTLSDVRGGTLSGVNESAHTRSIFASKNERKQNENINIAKLKAIVSSFESSLNEFKPVFGKFCDEHGTLKNT